MRPLWVLMACVLALNSVPAAPPTLTAPAEVKGEVSAFVVVKATASGSKWVKYVPLDSGLSVFPSDLLADKTVTVVVASKAGKYRVLAYTGNDEGGAEAVTTLVIGKVEDGTPIPTEPPVDPPVKPSGKKHFVIVRASGVGSPDSNEKVFALPAWAEVAAAGHTFSDMPFGRLPASVKETFAKQSLPFLLVCDYVNGKPILPKGSTAGKAPTTDDEVRGLLK